MHLSSGQVQPEERTASHQPIVEKRSPLNLEQLFAAAEGGQLQWNADLLWQLATLPPSAIDAHPARRLRRLWPPLGALQAIHDVAGWEERHGLLPAWVVTSTPLRFTFTWGSTLVYPECALWRGRRGVGYADLNLIHGRSRLYVSWTPAPGGEGRVQARMGMPPDMGRFCDVDELDLVNAYHCVTCGRFLARSQYERHKHAGEKPGDKARKRTDLLNQPGIVLQAKLASARTRVALQYVDQPAAVLDEGILARAVTVQSEVAGVGHDPPALLSSHAHHYACVSYLQRCNRQPDTRQRMAEILDDSAWRHAALKLEGLIAGHSVRTFPAYAALGRLLAAFSPRRTRAPLHLLDRELLLLAALARHAGHNPAVAVEVRRAIGADEKLLARFLHCANLHAPELLQWALSWAELFAVHTLN